MLYMVTFTINIPQMLAYIPYMDPMGNGNKGFTVDLAVSSAVIIKTYVYICYLIIQHQSFLVQASTYQN